MKLKSCDQTLSMEMEYFQASMFQCNAGFNFTQHNYRFCKTLKFVVNWDERDFECFLALSV